MMKKICPFILSVILVCAILPASVDASYEIPGTYQVQTDIGTACAVKTVDLDYQNNTYFSLRDIAMLLKDTGRSFGLEIAKNAVALDIGGAYAPVGTEGLPWESGVAQGHTLRRNEFKVNGQKVSYHTMIMELPTGHYDCFMMAADLAMILDVDITVPVAGILQIHTQAPFTVSPVALEQAGYFSGVNSVLVGDATTGEIYYEYHSDIPYPIASTSKLMTCLLTMDAISAGQIAYEQPVTISAAAQALSATDDGVIPLEAGQQVTVHELLIGALLPSSNECALCLAETVAGSEGAFVQRMQQKASELGLSQAVFYNCHGLPAFTQDPIPAKRQNHMSAADMFRLASYLLNVYPQIKDITSLEKATLPSLGREVRNTNPLLNNLPGVTGLKTGTTNKAGACLVTSLSVHDGIMEHDLVVVVLGTEDSVERGRVSGLLARYALQAFHSGAEGPESETVPGALPVQAGAAVDQILRTARTR